MEHEQGILEVFPAPADQRVASAWLQESNILNLIPEAVCVCDMAGIIQKYNEQAAHVWGRRPVLGDLNERFTGALRLYYPDGTLLPYDQTPVASCLKDGLPRKNVAIIIERPDLSRIHVQVNVLPIMDDAGLQVGIIDYFYDITEKKEAEQKSQHKTIALNDYFENASIGLHWVDENGIIKWANRAELEMLGYGEEEYIGHHIAEFHVDRKKIDDILYRLSCNETLYQYESELYRKDGTIKTVHISSSVFWEDGKFVHTRCFTIDITEQKKLAQAISGSESRYRKLIESMQTPLYTTDTEGRIMLFNKAAVELWGREPEIGKDLWCGSYKILKPDGSNLPLDSCPMAVCLTEQKPVYGEEIIVIRPDGSRRIVAPHPQPVYDEEGNMTGAINMLVDITDIKQTEIALQDSEAKYRKLSSLLEKEVEKKVLDLKRKSEDLKKSEERYHKMVEEVEDYAILLLSKEGIVQNWNKGAEKIKGYKEEEIVGKSFEEFYLPEDRANKLPLKLLKLARETGKAIHEGWRKRKDGTTFWGSIVLTALHDDDNNLIGFSKVTRDLTERKLTEDKMNEYLNQLEFQNKELEQFVYAASHDMKEPLRKIHFYNDYISLDEANQLSLKSAEYLSRSINSVERMKKLIDDLLGYSRSTSNIESYDVVYLNEVINDIVLMHKEELERKNGKIHIGKLPVIKAVPFQIKQLLFNLVNNAVKYKHPNRDLQVSVTHELVNAGEIQEYKVEPAIQYHKISVTDNGVGFDAQYSNKIFEIFQRLNNVSEAMGSGIGLAICKKIVQNHRGFIKATGKPDKGASFSIYLPSA